MAPVCNFFLALNEEIYMIDGKEDILKKAVKDENKKIKQLRFIIDLTMNVIAQSDITLEDASQMVVSTRDVASRLFPGKEEVYDLIYKPRLQRLLTEKYRLH